MTSSVTRTFDDINDYIVSNSDKIDVDSGNAVLKLIDLPGQSFIENYSSDAGFTYDSNEVEWTGTQVEGKDQTASNSKLGSDFLTDFSANWNKTGTEIATLNGTPVYNSGKVDCFGAHGLYYDTTLENTGSIKFLYTPNYTNGPAQNVNMVAMYDGTGSNQFILTNSPSGNNLRITIRDNTGTTINISTLR